MREAFRWLAIYKAGSDSGIEQIEKRRHFYDTLTEIGGNQELDRIMPAMQIHLLRMQTLPYQTAEDKRLQLLSYSEVTEAVLAGNPKLAERAMRKHLRRTRAHLKHVSDAAFAPPKAGL
jgi:DNA-binding GntR family transcriptional regulator